MILHLLFFIRRSQLLFQLLFW